MSGLVREEVRWFTSGTNHLDGDLRTVARQPSTWRTVRSDWGTISQPKSGRMKCVTVVWLLVSV